MKRRTLLGALVFVTFCVSCGVDLEQSVVSFEQGDCVKNLPLIPHSPTQDVIIGTDGLYIKLTYKKAPFRCEQKAKFVVSQEKNVLKVTARPVDLNPTVVASCDCKFDLTGKLGPYQSGDYTVKVFHQTDNYGSPSKTKEVHSEKVTLSGSEK